eukprot:Rmarinus@m.21730
MKSDEKSLSIEKKGYRPPFWSSQVWGDAYGTWKEVPAPRIAPVSESSRRRARKTGERLDMSRSAPRELVPGAVPQKAGDESMRKSTTKRLAIPPSRVEELENQLRKALKKRETLYLPAKKILIDQFRRAEKHEDTPPMKISLKGFSHVMHRFGIDVGHDEAAAFFSKYGHDTAGLLPYNVFVARLLATRGQLIGYTGCRRGTFTLTEPKSELTYSGLIKYPQCRTPVYPPSDWNLAKALRSREEPTAQLKLEFVYGYSGLNNLANNVYYTFQEEIVYYTAAVGIVYNKAEHTQRFFFGHNDDITCLAISPDRRLVASGQVGKRPYVCVWEVETMRRVAKLRHPDERGICAVCFSSDARYVVAVGMDDHHTLHVWDWRKETGINEQKAANGTPPQVHGALWSPFEAHCFCTWGVKHIKFWRLVDGNYIAKPGQFKSSPIVDITCAAWLPDGLTCTGTSKGSIYLWSENAVIKTVQAHKGGATTCVVLQSDQRTMLSAGADGIVQVWDVSGGRLVKVNAISIPAEAHEGVPVLRALDSFPGSNVFIAGSDKCDIWEVDETPEILIEGHSADAYMVACHPFHAPIFATAAEGRFVHIWDADDRKCLRKLYIGTRGRSVCWSHDGSLIACGCKNGMVKVFDYATQDAVFEAHDCREAIDEIKFSPDDRYLAVGSHDNFIDIYDTNLDFKRVGRCKGHSSYITHLDWSEDSKFIMSNCGSYEIMVWSIPRCKQSTIDHRNTPWQSWTCVLGFPVMGIWPDYSDGTDVNALDRAHNQQYLATADDFGGVKLFNYPCVMEDNPCVEYRGHSSHVMGVRFTVDDARLITVGGHDRAVFQWAVVGMPKASHGKTHVGKGIDLQWPPKSTRSLTDGHDKGKLDETKKQPAMTSEEAEGYVKKYRELQAYIDVLTRTLRDNAIAVPPYPGEAAVSPQGELRVHVHRGRKLKSPDRFDGVNGYVEGVVATPKADDPTRVTKTRPQKTKVVKESESPVWNDTLSFTLAQIVPESVVSLRVMDNDPYYGDDVVGEKSFTLSALLRRLRGSVNGRAQTDPVWLKLDGSSAEVEVSVEWKTLDPGTESKKESRVDEDEKTAKSKKHNLAGTLQVHVLSATKLKKADFINKNNPYAILRFDGKERRTKTITQTLEPKWDEKHSISTTGVDEDSKVLVSVMNEDEYSSSVLGSYSTTIGEIAKQGRIGPARFSLGERKGYAELSLRWIPQADEYQSEDEASGLRAEDIGSDTDIDLGKLTVSVIEGRLKSHSTYGIGDPYVQLEVCGKKKATYTRQQTTKPKWNQDVDFRLDLNADAVLVAVVKDRSRASSGGTFGRVEIPLKAAWHDGKLAPAWYDLSEGGELRLGVTYAPRDGVNSKPTRAGPKHRGTLLIDIDRASGFTENKSCEPYVTMKAAGVQKRTEVKLGTTSPTWSQELTMGVEVTSDDELIFTVRDDGVDSDDEDSNLASAHVPLRSLVSGSDKGGRRSVKGPFGLRPRGKIDATLKWTPVGEDKQISSASEAKNRRYDETETEPEKGPAESGRLSVRVLSARALSSSTLDAYVSVHVGSETRETRPTEGKNDLRWDQTLRFDDLRVDPKDSITLTVYDVDRVDKHDHYGRVNISWKDVLYAPNHHVKPRWVDAGKGQLEIELLWEPTKKDAKRGEWTQDTTDDSDHARSRGGRRGDTSPVWAQDTDTGNDSDDFPRNVDRKRATSTRARAFRGTDTDGDREIETESDYNSAPVRDEFRL